VTPLWPSVFGNDRPVEIEIGPGRGDVLVAYASARPETNFFAIEHQRGMADALALRLERAGLANARVIAADARCVVVELVPAASVASYHIYFPDPWPKRRHEKRRLFDAAFAAALRRTLLAGGIVHVATDLPDLFRNIAGVLHAAGFAPMERASPARPTTRFEHKYAQAGTHAAAFALR
jgi:tRNA (guanine-N7-)-methyltransferase